MRFGDQRPRHWGLVFGVIALVIVIVTVVAIQRARTDRITIAVVLFHNETGQSELDRLAQQLTDATVIALTANPNYAVIGNAAVLRTPRIFADLKKIGAELNADYILVAQLQNPPEGLIVRAHLISTIDQKHLWAKGITGPAAFLEPNVVQVVTAGVRQSLGK